MNDAGRRHMIRSEEGKKKQKNTSKLKEREKQIELVRHNEKDREHGATSLIKKRVRKTQVF